MTTARDRRPLTGFLGAVGVSALGTRMSFLALPWLVLTTLLAAAALYGLTTLEPFVFPVWRQMDRRPAPRERARATVTGRG